MIFGILLLDVGSSTGTGKASFLASVFTSAAQVVVRTRGQTLRYVLVPGTYALRHHISHLKSLNHLRSTDPLRPRYRHAAAIFSHDTRHTNNSEQMKNYSTSTEALFIDLEVVGNLLPVTFSIDQACEFHSWPKN